LNKIHFSLIATVLHAVVATTLGGFVVPEKGEIGPNGEIIASRECDVESILAQIDVPRGTIAIGGLGRIVEVDMLLVPTTLEAGLYRVSLTRKEDNLYEIIGEDLYVRTRFCYEFCYSADALLELQTYSGVNLGKVIFL
jgi:hypothetical protein